MILRFECVHRGVDEHTKNARVDDEGKRKDDCHGSNQAHLNSRNGPCSAWFGLDGMGM